MNDSGLPWEKIRRKALNRLYPEERDLKELEEAYTEIEEFIESKGLEAFFAGSAGRGTCMKGDRDIDVFIMFPESVERQELEKRGLQIGREVFDEFNGEYEVEYAEHPYTKGEIGLHEVEVVPCYDTDPENIRSAVDRSPHHAKWVDGRLSQSQREDVVLLKAFLRASGIYGSSLKTRGFSGYLCELLIYEAGSLRKLLEEAEDWRKNKVIDPADHHPEGLSGELEKKFSESALVVIDPVDPERNVASVLTEENYAEFVFKAWKFNSMPGLNFFQKEDIVPDKFLLKKEVRARADFLVLEFDKPDRPDDILYPQMRKVQKRMLSVLEDHGFRVYESGFHVGESVRMFFELDEQLPDIGYQKGPRIFHGTEHLEQFTEKYENTFIQGDRIVAKTEREYSNARNLLKDFLEGQPEELEEKGIPGNVAEKIQAYRLVDVLQEDEEWLKFLFKKLKLVQ